MNWKFWKRNSGNGDAGNGRKVKLPGPKDMPQQVGQYLVIREKMDPDWVWHLKCVVRPHDESRTALDFRVYSPKQASETSVRVADFNTLEVHPELILFQGWFDKRNNQLFIEKRAA